MKQWIFGLTFLILLASSSSTFANNDENERSIRYQFQTSAAAIEGLENEFKGKHATYGKGFKDEDGRDTWVVDHVLRQTAWETQPDGIYSYWYSVLFLFRASYMGFGFVDESSHQYLQGCVRAFAVGGLADNFTSSSCSSEKFTAMWRSVEMSKILFQQLHNQTYAYDSHGWGLGGYLVDVVTHPFRIFELFQSDEFWRGIQAFAVHAYALGYGNTYGAGALVAALGYNHFAKIRPELASIDSQMHYWQKQLARPGTKKERKIRARYFRALKDMRLFLLSGENKPASK